MEDGRQVDLTMKMPSNRGRCEEPTLAIGQSEASYMGYPNGLDEPRGIPRMQLEQQSRAEQTEDVRRCNWFLQRAYHTGLAIKEDIKNG